MSISSRITQIENHLEDDYKALENLGASVTDRNIENIKDMAEQIYDNYPKTSYQEGTSITLENCNKGKLDFENGVVGIGQTEQESTNGYQLIPYTLATLKTLNTGGTWNDNVYTFLGVTYTVELEDGYIKQIKTTGTATGNSFMLLINSLTISAGTYYVSGCPNGGSVLTYFIYAGSGLTHNTSDTPAATTLNEDVSLTSNNLRITIMNGTNANNLVWKPMLSKTNTTDYEPYTGGQASPNPSYPQEIKCVTGNQEVVVRGINKLPKPFSNRTEDVTLTKNNDGTYVLNGSTGSSDVYIQGIDISSYGIKGKKLICMPSNWNSSNGYATTRYTNNTWGGNDVGSGASVDSTKTVAFIALLLRANSTFDNVILKPMITDDTSATYNDYEPYITPITKTLALGDIELFEIVRNSSSIVRDKIIKMNGKFYKEKNVGKVEVDSTLNPSISLASTNTARVVFSNLLANNPPMTISGVIGYSNYFKQNANWSLDEEGFFYDAGNYALWFRGNKSTIGATEEAILSWVHANKPYFIYPLATPVLEEITDETLISQLEAWYNAQSIKGTTIIESNGDLPLIIKVRALKGA